MVAGYDQAPDSPFRIGITGKYKLLTKTVTPKSYDYEYDMIDGEGREYKAHSQKRFAENQILRCMVHFTILNARLVVSDTLICNKQDFTAPLPEIPIVKDKARVEVTTKPQKKVQAGNESRRKQLGDPRYKRVSGMYVFRVAEVEENDSLFLYRVEDAKGYKYEVQSKKSYATGCLVDCRVKVVLTSGGVLKVSALSIKKHVTRITEPGKKHKKASSLKHWHANSNGHDWPSPAKGDFFRLIYTPMGNKR